MIKRTDELCEITVIHQDTIDKVKNKMPNEEQLNQMTLFFKSFADSTRLRLLSALLEAEMCVCDLAALIDMSQSAISHQLRILRQARLVKTRRDGKVIYYSLDDDHVDHVMRLVIDHLEHD